MPAIADTTKNISELNGKRTWRGSSLLLLNNKINTVSCDRTTSANKPYFKNTAMVTHCTRYIGVPLMFNGNNDVRIAKTPNAAMFQKSISGGG